MRRRVRPGSALLPLALALARALLCAPPARAAESPKPEFFPKAFGPGEEVRAVLVLPGLDAAEGFTLKPGSGLPASEDPELRELELARGSKGWELRVRFVPWSPGSGRLPAISARGLSLPSIPYQAGSRLGPGDREISAPRPQREPPGAAIYLYGIAGAALALALAVAGTVAYLVPAASALLARRRAAQAFRRLAESLDYLAAGASSADPPAFYSALARALRLYLEERAHPGACALTAAELAALPGAAFPATGLRDEAAAIIRESELARYSGFRPGAAAMGAAARRARELGVAVEEALDARL